MADDDDTENLPAIISRADAMASGLKTYFESKPCLRGHLSERRVYNRSCVACERLKSAARWERVRPEPKPVSEYAHYNHAAAAAKAAGRTRYFDGRPCKHGHIGERMVGNHGCVECNLLRAKLHPDYNSEERKAKARARDAADPEKKARRMRDYFERNPEKVKAASRKRRLENIEKYAAYQRNRVARRKAAEGSHTAEDIKRIYKAQKGKCACCREKVGADHQVDHIVPLAKGGTNWPRNLQILCPSCNRRKHAHDAIAFMQRLGFLL